MLMKNCCCLDRKNWTEMKRTKLVSYSIGIWVYDVHAAGVNLEMVLRRTDITSICDFALRHPLQLVRTFGMTPGSNCWKVRIVFLFMCMCRSRDRLTLWISHASFRFRWSRELPYTHARADDPYEATDKHAHVCEFAKLVKRATDQVISTDSQPISLLIRSLLWFV